MRIAEAHEQQETIGRLRLGVYHRNSVTRILNDGAPASRCFLYCFRWLLCPVDGNDLSYADDFVLSKYP